MMFGFQLFMSIIIIAVILAAMLSRYCIRNKKSFVKIKSRNVPDLIY
jgi:hypothetical protein